MFSTNVLLFVIVLLIVVVVSLMFNSAEAIRLLKRDERREVLRIVNEYQQWLGAFPLVTRTLINLRAELNGEGLNSGTPGINDNCTISGLRTQLSQLAWDGARVGGWGTYDDLRSLLQEVRGNCTRDDDLPDGLLPRIDKALDGDQNKRCKGRNCGTMVNGEHSKECVADHEASCGGYVGDGSEVSDFNPEKR